MKEGKLLITGSNGFLGNNLADYFSSRGYKVYGADLSPSSIRSGVEYHKGDLSQYEITHTIFDKIRPNYVINTVALVDLDVCEENTELAHMINVQTAENIAKCSKKFNSRLIHISTDHLFDGNKAFYTEEDKTSPVNNYGLTKRLGEQACFNNHDDVVAVRTNFYGWSHSAHKPTFGEWMYYSLKQNKQIKLFTDYYFTPIDISSLAEAIDIVMSSDHKGVINIAGSERCSKYEFGLAMAEIFRLDASAVTPSKMEPGSFKVKRQQDLSLFSEKYSRLFKRPLPDVKMGLLRFRNQCPKIASKT